MKILEGERFAYGWSKDRYIGALIVCQFLINYFEHWDDTHDKSSYKRATQTTKELGNIIDLECGLLPLEHKPNPYLWHLLNAFLAAGIGSILTWIWIG